MGTRALTVIENDQQKEIVVLYRQFDGYPDGHGRELGLFLANIQLVNGLSMKNPPKVTNGMECLAAQVIGHFKVGVAGQFYLYPAGTRDCGEEYRYTVYPADGMICVRCETVSWEGVPKSVMFEGTALQFSEWVGNYHSEDFE